jgi:TetR/AcrR family transcriptional regulator, transcriptional repressor for nem operon
MSRISNPKPSPLTPRGAATKLRIVETAAKLVYAKGAERMSLDEVMEASRTSKSQLYHYFADKDALVREVIDFQTRRILQANAIHLDRLDSFAALRAWRDWVVAANRAGGRVGGCPIGSLANELATQSEEARDLLVTSFEAWSGIIEAGLARMKEQGQIIPSADTRAISLAVLAAIQGGILLSKAARDSKPLELAFDMALSHIERYAARPARSRESSKLRGDCLRQGLRALERPTRN